WSSDVCSSDLRDSLPSELVRVSSLQSGPSNTGLPYRVGASGDRQRGGRLRRTWRPHAPRCRDLQGETDILRRVELLLPSWGGAGGHRSVVGSRHWSERA